MHMQRSNLHPAVKVKMERKERTRYTQTEQGERQKDKRIKKEHSGGQCDGENIRGTSARRQGLRMGGGGGRCGVGGRSGGWTGRGKWLIRMDLHTSIHTLT